VPLNHQIVFVYTSIRKLRFVLNGRLHVALSVTSSLNTVAIGDSYKHKINSVKQKKKVKNPK
jgi:hypothetical protein